MDEEEKWLLEEKYSGTESFAFRADLELLKNGTPLAYLIGSIPFLDCTIHLDSHPLIPRSETEFWTEQAIKVIRNFERTYERTYDHNSPQGSPRELPGQNPRPGLGLALGRASGEVHVLDLCAGSGAIGVAVAKAIPQAQVDFAEIDPAHLPTIEKNIEHNLKPTCRRSNLQHGQCRVIESNLFTPSAGLNRELGKYDFILTNPPYIDPAIDRTETSVKLHEPHLALYGGAEGMECIAKIIAEAPKHLTLHGQLWIEHEPEQVDAITALAAENDLFSTTHNDQYNTPRYSVVTRTVAE